MGRMKDDGQENRDERLREISGGRGTTSWTGGERRKEKARERDRREGYGEELQDTDEEVEKEDEKRSGGR